MNVLLFLVVPPTLIFRTPKRTSMSGVKRAIETVGEEDENSQFTAASILKSAYETSKNELKTADFKIADLEELRYFQQRKRTEYENVLRRNRFNYGQWMRYAQFEIDQKDIQRARSVFERALEVDYKNVSMWVRYIQTEIKHKNINHARNLLERGIKLLPRVDKLWYLYITIEESIGNVVAVGEIFENWIQWKPVKDVWLHYIEFKERYEEYEEERLIFEKLVTVFNTCDSWLRWIDFEKKHGDFVNVENVFKLGVNSLYSQSEIDAKFLTTWIRYEYSRKRNDKVRELYEFGFKTLSDKEKFKLQNFQTDFSKQYEMDGQNVEKYVLQKRKLMYEDKLKKFKTDYETWWLYFTLIIDASLEIKEQEIREKFELALSSAPSDTEATQWIQYWYICHRYALWEEFSNKNIDNSKKIYEKLLKQIPHKTVFIYEFWVKYGDFELRNFDLTHLRKILGQAIGVTANDSIIKYYIGIELKFKYFERVRKLYDKLIELYPKNWHNWVDYFNFEDSLGNDLRSSSIVEIAIFHDFVDSKGKIKIINSVINTLIDNYGFSLARRLLEYKVELNAKNVDYVIQRCLLELKIPSEEQIKKYQSNEGPRTEEGVARDDNDPENDNGGFEVTTETKDAVRKQYERFLAKMKETGDVQNRIVLLESLRDFEKKYGDAENADRVQSRLPSIERKTRLDANGNQEEYIEYVFAEDEKEIEEQVAMFKNDFLTELDGIAENGEEAGHPDDNGNDDGNDDREDDDDDEEEEEEKEEGEEDSGVSRQKTFKSRFASDSEEEEEEAGEEAGEEADESGDHSNTAVDD